MREALTHVHAASENKKILEVKFAWAIYLVSWTHFGPQFYAVIEITVSGTCIVMSGGVQAHGRTKSLSLLLVLYKIIVIHLVLLHYLLLFYYIIVVVIVVNSLNAVHRNSQMCWPNLGSSRGKLQNYGQSDRMPQLALSLVLE